MSTTYKNLRDYLAARFPNKEEVKTIVCDPPIGFPETDLPIAGTAREQWQHILNSLYQKPAWNLLIGELIAICPYDCVLICDLADKWNTNIPLPHELIQEIYIPSESDPGGVFTVWFGTNRKPLSATDISQGFTSERNDKTILGRVKVWVPEVHRFGSIGSSFWTRIKRLDFRDDNLKIQQIEGCDAEAFWAGVEAEMTQGDALVFLHGYNNSFKDAAIRAAQIGFDLRVPGATAFFSWPSRGSLKGYTADEASIEASEREITEFLVDFVAKCGTKKVHLIAHSMGNRGLLRALQRIAANVEKLGKVSFGQIFLAAPDVDRDLFLDLARLYPACSVRTTLYASNGDLPVCLSSKFHDAPRAGYFSQGSPYTVAPDIDTVAVPDFNIDLLGHAYFAQAAALLNDIYNLIRNNPDPPRQRMHEEIDVSGQIFWEMEL